MDVAWHGNAIPYEGNELIDRIPAGGAQEFMVQLLGFVGRAKHVC